MLHVPGMPEGVHVSFSPEQGSAMSSAQPDPVFALIDAHRSAYAAWEPVAAVWNEAMGGTPEYAAAEAAAEEPGRRERAAFRALLEARPATAAGLWALTAYLQEATRKVSPDAQTEEQAALDILREGALRLGLATVQAEAQAVSPRHVDPMLAAIERHRLSHDAFGDTIDASDRVIIRERGGDLSAGALALADANRDAADAADEQAWREIFAVRPTTVGGLFALLHHLGDHHHSYEGMDNQPAVFAALAEMVQGLTLPAAGAVQATSLADPHIALVPALRQAFAWTREAQPFCDERPDSPEGRAYTAVLHHCWDLSNRIVALPAPVTPAGLGALALALMVWAEGSIGNAQNDGLDHERYPEERRLASAIRSMLSVTGVEMLADWGGFGDEPDSQALWDAMLERVGEGSLPAWALTCKSEPDTDDLPEESTTLIDSPTTVAEPATALLTRYVGWLGREFGEAHDELLRLNPALMEPRNSWSAPRTPIGGLYMCHEFADPVTSAVVDAAPASTRAALDLSTVGCDWGQP